jgi:hypothetical protein
MRNNSKIHLRYCLYVSDKWEQYCTLLSFNCLRDLERVQSVVVADIRVKVFCVAVLIVPD